MRAETNSANELDENAVDALIPRESSVTNIKKCNEKDFASLEYLRNFY